MKTFKPSFPYSTAIELLIPTYKKIKGVTKPIFPEKGIPLNCSFKSYGGTETTNNGVYSVEDTANVETWYRPDIKSDCRIRVMQTGDVFEIINRPENINMRNQFCRFKVEAIRGDA